MKVLVTGATGFIGNYVVTELLKNGIQVIACGRTERSKIKFNWIDKVSYYKVDLNDQKKNWFSYFNKPEVLIHLSWSGLPNYSGSFHIEKNLFQNYYFIKNLIHSGLKNINITGTCLEYGMVEGELDESLHTKPHNSYALAKDSLRKFIELLKKESKFQLKWIRLFYMYGEGQNAKSILSQLDMALKLNHKNFNMSKGEQIRDYLPVEKVAEYIVKIAMQNEILGIINCCSGEPISIKELVKNYLIKNNKQIQLNLGHYPYADYEPMEFWGKNNKLKSILRTYEH